MKNIYIYNAEKYNNDIYEKIEDGIYKTICKSTSKIGVEDETILKKLKSTNLFGLPKLKWTYEKDINLFKTCLKGKNYYKNNDNIYFEDEPDEEVYVMSISFEQEPDFGEGNSSKNISQYPLEDILDKYYVSISDFYNELNDGSNNICYLEFEGLDLEDIMTLKEILGKHVYNKETEGKVDLIIE